MGSIALLARLQLKRRYRALVTVAVVIGIVGGIAVSLVAGSRRSASVVDRYFRAGTHYDVNVFGYSLTRPQVLALPGVRRADPRAYLAMVTQRKGTAPTGVNGYAIDPAALDPVTEILRGRAPKTDDPFGVTVNESFVSEFGARVGDPVDVQMFTDADGDNLNAGVYRPTGPRFRFHIVGIVRTPDDVVLDDVHNVKSASQDPSNALFAPFSFYEKYRKSFFDFGAAFDVQLDAPPDRARFVAAAQALAPGEQAVAFGPTSFSQRRASIDTPVSLESSLLLGLGIALAIAGVVVVGLLLRAERRAQSVDDQALRALGFTRTDFGLVAALRVLPFAVAGALLSVGVAFALSARYPVGVGREIELHRGFDANVAVLGLAPALTVLLVVGLAFAFGRFSARRARRSRRAGSAADWLTRVGAPVDAYVGTHLAFERDGERSMSSRQAVAGGAVALAMIAALGIVVGGIGDLYGRPAAHGWPWNLVIGNPNFPLSNATVKRLAVDARIRTQTVANYGQASIDGKTFGVLAIDQFGTAPPRVLRGRLPTSEREMALGEKVARALHVDVGSRVRFSIAGGDYATEGPTHDIDATVVGIALPPVLGDTDLGDVGIVTLHAITAAGGVDSQRFVLARVDGGRSAITAIGKSYSPEMATDIVPARVVNLHRTRWLLLLASALAAILGSLLLLYTLAVGARLRTRQLAILRALGMTRRRVGRVLAAQGVVLALAMCLIGIPVGVAAGSIAWRVIAHQLGVGELPVISPAIALLVPIAIGVGLGAAIVPGRRVRRGDVGRLLHAE